MTTKTLTYQDGDTRCEAYVALPQVIPAPAVLIAPAWAGRDEFACAKARMLAENGYVGFALDMYGDAKTGTSNEENTKLITPFMENREHLRQRITAALTAAQSLDEVDNSRIAAMGFCFGGLCVLDLARSGADVRGVVSFHGLLQEPEGLANEDIKAKILAFHGYDDPLAPPEQMNAFMREMTSAGVDWQLHAYGRVKHAFTNPEAHDTELGLIYNKTAEERSLQAMKNFFAEIF